VVPAQVLSEVEGNEDAKDDQRNDLLNDFELHGRKTVCAEAVGGNLETVFEEGNPPADEDDLPKGLVPEAEMTVQAKVMKMLEMVSKITVHIRLLDADGWNRVAAAFRMDEDAQTGMR